MHKSPLLATFGLIGTLLGAVVPLRADVPVPPSVMDPKTPAEAWNVIRLATTNAEQLTAENRLAEVSGQVALCNPALRNLAALAAPEQQAKVREQTVLSTVFVNSVAQSAMVGDQATAQESLNGLKGALDALKAYYPAEVVGAEIYFCPMHPDFTSTAETTPCDKCGMSLNKRRIPHSFVYMPPGKASLKAVLEPEQQLTPGKPVAVKLRLSQASGAPVELADLMVVHTEPIHLLIVDPSLQDYHHEHPTPTGTPGEYTFSFTPKLASRYRVFVDVVPIANGVQEYVMAELPGAPGEPAQPRENNFKATAGGLNFLLEFDSLDGSPPKPAQVREMRVTVTDATGQPVKTLMPVMGTFAHMVGFYADYETVVHLHPTGGDILNPAARGGPQMGFKFYAPKAGFIRLYCQVLVDGNMLFAPFDVNIVPQ